ncbi:unnamed protein product, partial [Oikopleura dioica]
ALEAIILIYSK